MIEVVGSDEFERWFAGLDPGLGDPSGGST
jgi:hypothetical protein